MSYSPNLLVLAEPSLQHLRALDRAVAIASTLGSELHVQTILSEPQFDWDIFHWSEPGPGATDRDLAISIATEKLSKWAEDQPIKPASIDAAWGHPLDEAVLPVLRERRIDLLVMATRDPAGRRLSRAEWRLLRMSPSPVWLVRSDHWPSSPRFAGAIDPQHDHDQALQVDRAILDAVSDVSSAFGARFDLVHAMGQVPGGIAVAQSPAEFQAERSHGARQRIEGLLTTHHKNHLGEIALLDQEPLPGIPEYCVRQAVDLVVMGLFARSRLADLLIGSSVRGFLENSSNDVLFVKGSSER